MPNWTSIATTDLEQFVVASMISSLNEAALGDTQDDRFTECAEQVVAEVRMAVATSGKELDTDATKIPRSLLGPACWLIANYMAQGLGVPLTDQQANEVSVARDLIRDVASGDRAVEVPDSTDSTPDAQTGGAAELVTSSTRCYTRTSMAGL